MVHQHEAGAAAAGLASVDNRTIGGANELTGIPWKRTVLALFLFGTAFGYLEAAVVSYLRELHEPARQRFHPGRSRADLFPLATLDQLRETGDRADANTGN